VSAAIPEPWDGKMPLDLYKWMVRRQIKIQTAKASSMLKAVGADGTPLYKLNENGNFVRTRQFSSKRRREVLERDAYCCVWCAGMDWLEVDHIVRYIDGGSDEMDNLRTLCRPCHGSRGGRA
jgi:hypothetical protein